MRIACSNDLVLRTHFLRTQIEAVEKTRQGAVWFVSGLWSCLRGLAWAKFKSCAAHTFLQCAGHSPIMPTTKCRKGWMPGGGVLFAAMLRGVSLMQAAN